MAQDDRSARRGADRQYQGHAAAPGRGSRAGGRAAGCGDRALRSRQARRAARDREAARAVRQVRRAVEPGQSGQEDHPRRSAAGRLRPGRRGLSVRRSPRPIRSWSAARSRSTSSADKPVAVPLHLAGGVLVKATVDGGRGPAASRRSRATADRTAAVRATRSAQAANPAPNPEGLPAAAALAAPFRQGAQEAGGDDPPRPDAARGLAGRPRPASDRPGHGADAARRRPPGPKSASRAWPTAARSKPRPTTKRSKRPSAPAASWTCSGGTR